MDMNLAIETLKAFLENSDNVIVKDAILELHPELKESENERIRKRLIDCLKFSLKGAEEQDAAGCSRQKDIEAYKWGIAYLEKQKEQKPAEWSEEDEKIRHDIIARLESLLKYETQYIAKTCLQKEISWFKLLRSRPKPFDYWVPTEEQLHALYLASYGGELSSEDCLELDSLLIDLKKLYSL